MRPSGCCSELTLLPRVFCSPEQITLFQRETGSSGVSSWGGCDGRFSKNAVAECGECGSPVSEVVNREAPSLVSLLLV